MLLNILLTTLWTTSCHVHFSVISHKFDTWNANACNIYILNKHASVLIRLIWLVLGLTWSCSLSATTMRTGRWTQTGQRRCRSALMPRHSPSREETTRHPTNPCTWSMCVSREGTPSRLPSQPAAVWVLLRFS